MAFEVMVLFAIGSFTYLIYHECQSYYHHITTNYPDLDTIGSLWVFYFKYAFFYDYDIQWNESSKS